MRAEGFLARIRTFAIAFCLAWSAAAQAAVVHSPPGYEFVRAADASPVLFDGDGRFQQIHAAEDFASAAGPLTITHVLLAPEFQFAIVDETVELRVTLATTPTAPSAATAAFGDQLHQNVQVVLDGTGPVQSFGPRFGAPVALVLATPYRYDPERGNLVLDVVYRFGSGGTPIGKATGRPSVAMLTADDPEAETADTVERDTSLVTLFAGTLEGSLPARLVVDATPGSTTLPWNLGGLVVGDRLVTMREQKATGREPWLSDGTPEGTGLLADLMPGNADGRPEYFAAVGNLAFFRAIDPLAGQELWASDGTRAGTYRVADIRPGPLGSSPWFGIALGEHLYFVADDGTPGGQIWRSDGTAEGTERVAFTSSHGNTRPQDLTADGSVLWFRQGFGVWSSDGTQAGTALVAGAYNPTSLLAVGDQLFFVSEETQDPASGRELYTSDGTSEGTGMVVDLNPGEAGSNPSGFVRAGGRLYFEANDGVGGTRLWTSDGTAAGTWQVDGPAFRRGRILGVLDDGIAFTTPPTSALWRSDGTPEGTYHFADAPGAVAQVGGGLVDTDHLWFTASTPEHGTEVWRTDGTEVGTMRVSDLAEGPADLQVRRFVGRGQRIYFTARRESVGGDELFTSDGTPENTRAVGLVHGEPGASRPSSFEDAAGTTFFGIQGGTWGEALWRVDGLRARRLQDHGASGTYGVVHLESFLGALYYPGHDGELWRSDGTPEGTEAITSSASQREAPDPSLLLSLDDRLVFAADLASGLWASDGTTEGTAPIADVSRPQELTRLGNQAVFGATHATHGIEPWITDGTAAGTRLLRDLHPGTSHGLPREFTPLGDALLFQARVSGIGAELFRTDGSEAGTVLVADVWPGALSSTPVELVPMGAEIFFTADDGLHGRELWASDGTEAGTRLVADLRPGADAGNPTGLRAADGKLYFQADDGVHGDELWTSDGTAEGTRMIADLSPGEAGSWIAFITAVSGGVAFRACMADLGCELWTSDGTAKGTRLLADVSPGDSSSNPELPWVTGPWLYFRADDGVRSGVELFAIELGTCGDGRIGPTERCDDGNEIPGDGCDANCRLDGPCADGIDNDGDGAIDHPQDPGCAWAGAQTESPACDDGIDNDGDGLVDFAGTATELPDPVCQLPWLDDESVRPGCAGAHLAWLAPLLWAVLRREGGAL